MDVQHMLAVKMADFLDGNSIGETEEKLLLIFGIEVFLNEFLKIVVLLILALFVGELPITCLSMLYFLMLRKYAKGKHCTSNMKCYLATIVTTFLMPICIQKIRLSAYISACMLVIVTLVFVVKLSGLVYKEKILFLILYLGLYCGFLVGGAGYVNAMLSVSLVVALEMDSRSKMLFKNKEIRLTDW